MTQDRKVLDWMWFKPALETMDEKSADTPVHLPRSVAEAVSPSIPEALPGTEPRERATPEGDGLDPTRYGDWEKNGRCIDF